MRSSIPLECVHVAVVVMVALYLAATLGQTRKHPYLMSSMGDLSKLSLIRYKRQDLDRTAYATFISSTRLVLDATVKRI